MRRLVEISSQVYLSFLPVTLVSDCASVPHGQMRIGSCHRGIQQSSPLEDSAVGPRL